ncbi:nuclear transport factor 2 family protein [Kitasatospora sp. CB01950]|uniref:nuclear transport factor 2 family protein n=1 Tax=Kitasatospora sp. CB01950 TaxID=1703930 RepID=UPI00093B2C91|nr:nuclear transport factor 2 family protein [Kitasatospora sp. CB01950]
MSITAADRFEIHELLARYWKTVDEGDLQGFGATFTEDGSLTNYTGTTTGREALAQWLDDYGPSRVGNRHMSTNTIITEVDSDTATVWSYMVVIAAFEPRTQTPHVASYSRFNDRVARVGGRWLFKERVMDDLVLNAIDY